jgi:hypothetical protein
MDVCKGNTAVYCRPFLDVLLTAARSIVKGKLDQAESIMKIMGHDTEKAGSSKKVSGRHTDRPN